MNRPVALRAVGLFAATLSIGGLSLVAASRHAPTPQAAAQGPLEEAYALVATWDGSLGQGAPGSLLDPAGIAVTADAVYIVDRGNDRVQRFTPAGGFVAAWGQSGSDLVDFSRPQDIAVDGQLLYVTDRGNDRVVQYGTDGSPRAAWSVPGLAAPWGVAARGDRVYVTYPERGLVVVLRQGSEIGRWSQALEPRGIAVGPDGRVYVADYRASMIRIFTPDGVPAGELRTSLTPLDVAVDSASDIYVLHELLNLAAEGVILWYQSGSSSSRLAMYRAGLRGVAVSSITPGIPPRGSRCPTGDRCSAIRRGASTALGRSRAPSTAACGSSTAGRACRHSARTAPRSPSTCCPRSRSTRPCRGRPWIYR